MGSRMEAAESLPSDGTAPPEVTSERARSEDVGPGGLSPRELAILAFERQWWRFPGAKEHAIREEFGLSGTRYYQLLNQLLEKPEALRADPMLVKRLRKL